MQEQKPLVKYSVRNSNLELYRIVVMLLIVAHHYVVNSGLWDVMNAQPLTGKTLFLYLFGMWGKTGINCFVLITGYFMCKSAITVRKSLKLLLEVEFYNVAIFILFVLFGYASFSLKECFLALIPVHTLDAGFTSCFLVFYLCIPFLSILVQALNKRQHQLLLLLCLFIYTLMGTVPVFHVTMNYVSWFCVLFFVASYIRIYGLFKSVGHKQWGWLTIGFILLSMLSVVILRMLSDKFQLSHSYPYLPYRMVSDSNVLLALLTAVCSFMYFKDLKMKYSAFVNTVGASTFGVLLIHANSDTMRQWLWQDVLDNVGAFASDYLVVHAIVGVLAIFCICIVIDYIRIHSIERWVFLYVDKLLRKYNWR